MAITTNKHLLDHITQQMLEQCGLPNEFMRKLTMYDKPNAIKFKSYETMKTIKIDGADLSDHSEVKNNEYDVRVSTGEKPIRYFYRRKGTQQSWDKGELNSTNGQRIKKYIEDKKHEKQPKPTKLMKTTEIKDIIKANGTKGLTDTLSIKFHGLKEFAADACNECCPDEAQTKERKDQIKKIKAVIKDIDALERALTKHLAA